MIENTNKTTLNNGNLSGKEVDSSKGTKIGLGPFSPEVWQEARRIQTAIIQKVMGRKRVS